MSFVTRILLIAGAAIILLYFLFEIRKKRIHIHYAIYWTGFSGIIVLFSIFPGIVTKVSQIIGIEIPVHLMLMGVIILMILKLFHDTLKLSDLEKKVDALAQEIALIENEKNNTKKINGSVKVRLRKTKSQS